MTRLAIGSRTPDMALQLTECRYAALPAAELGSEAA
jgi:hypothetical protein